MDRAHVWSWVWTGFQPQSCLLHPVPVCISTSSATHSLSRKPQPACQSSSRGVECGVCHPNKPSLSSDDGRYFCLALLHFILLISACYSTAFPSVWLTVGANNLICDLFFAVVFPTRNSCEIYAARCGVA